jgi:hypothetical protein
LAAIGVAALVVIVQFGLPQTSATTSFPGVVELIVGGLVVGFVLDGLGAYALVPAYRAYQRTKSELATALREIFELPESTDPDQLLVPIWIRDETLYNRIMLERADWVVIMEIASSMMFGALVAALLAAADYEFGAATRMDMLALAVALFLLSVRISVKGVQRVAAYNERVKSAARRIRNDPSVEPDLAGLRS